MRLNRLEFHICECVFRMSDWVFWTLPNHSPILLEGKSLLRLFEVNVRDPWCPLLYF